MDLLLAIIFSILLINVNDNIKSVDSCYITNCPWGHMESLTMGHMILFEDLIYEQFMRIIFVLSRDQLKYTHNEVNYNKKKIEL